MSKKDNLYDRGNAAREERLRETERHHEERENQKATGIYKGAGQEKPRYNTDRWYEER